MGCHCLLRSRGILEYKSYKQLFLTVLGGSDHPLPPQFRRNWLKGLRTWCSLLSPIYFFFLKFFLMWTIFKVFIEFVAILLLFYVLVFWPRGILGSLTRDPITPALKGDVLVTGLPRKSLTFKVLNCFSDLFEKFMNVCLALLYTNSFLFPDRILSSLH